MEIVLLWILFALLVGWIGSGTTLGFGSSFLLSLLFSPIIGFIIVLLYPSKSHREKQIQEQQRQTQILQQISSSKISDADQIEKLKKQLDEGIITAEEFQAMKAKIISS